MKDGSITGILDFRENKIRRKDIRIVMLYKGLKGTAGVPTNDRVPQTGVSGLIILWDFKPN